MQLQKAMHVRVDPLICDAHGICVGSVPEVFELDDDDVLHILQPEPPANLADKVRQAVRSCPKTALTMDE